MNMLDDYSFSAKLCISSVMLIASGMAVFGMNLANTLKKEKELEQQLTQNKNNNFNINLS